MCQRDFGCIEYPEGVEHYCGKTLAFSLMKSPGGVIWLESCVQHCVGYHCNKHGRCCLAKATFSLVGRLRHPLIWLHLLLCLFVSSATHNAVVLFLPYGVLGVRILGGDCQTMASGSDAAPQQPNDATSAPVSDAAASANQPLSQDKLALAHQMLDKAHSTYHYDRFICFRKVYSNLSSQLCYVAK